MTKLTKHPVHLGLGASAVIEPAFTGVEWYYEYLARHEEDGCEGRLVSMFSFSEGWDSWEMHPNGAEVVICTEGQLILIQEIDGEERSTVLAAGEYAINPAGVWHTADVVTQATAVFITAGLGTEQRTREP
ncbi:MAG: cupin domain-containing protein [Myxococcales bacterium]|nr:cupin domain-containing protein [Myxococcales bacterium]